MSDPKRELRPIQVLLDVRGMIETPEPQEPRGGKKDFFEDDDAGFEQHKDRVRGRLRTIVRSLRNRGKGMGFLRVQLRENALAKSYRPIGSLFTPTHGFGLVGANHVGEMLFQGTSTDIERLDRIIDARAELTPRVVKNERTGELEKRVSGYRSEVGAIHDVKLHDREDRVAFSADQAVEWLSQPNALGGYIVELFRPDFSLGQDSVMTAIAELTDGFSRMGDGIAVTPFLPRTAPAKNGEPSLAVSVRLTLSPGSQIGLPFYADGQSARSAEIADGDDEELDLSIDRHQQLLDLLAEQTLVRNVDLPPVIEPAPVGSQGQPRGARIARPAPNVSYPVVGIIDGGAADLSELNAWKVGDAGLVPRTERDEHHGTFIAGLIVAGPSLNPHIASAFESGGCKFFDLDIFPRKDLRPRYFKDPESFFDVLDEKIKVAKRDFGVRVFNLSFGLRTLVPRTGYSQVADRLDRIALENDVILVLAAGNLPRNGGRPPWPTKPAEVVQMLAAFGAREGRISPPAEHLLGLTVGAINPPGSTGHAADMPTTYTRRGPGVGGARKPDLAFYGGVGSPVGGSNRTGLASLSPAGEAVENGGTSFASPPVAATVATLDARLHGRATRELLLSLPVHRATRHKALLHSSLKHISREFVGFGVAPPADVILMDDPYAITLVFSEVLKARQILQFPFVWPQSLVAANNSCRGRVDVTLAYTPPLDPAHKEEAQRIQLEAYLWQEAGVNEESELIWAPQLTLDGAEVPAGVNRTEKYMLMTGVKWSPIKKYYASMPKGRGESSSWRLGLKSTTRAGARFPAEGVPFTILMTISDPRQDNPIHDEVRNQLQSTGLKIEDIMVAHRVRPRGR